MLLSFLLIFTFYVELITPTTPHSTDATCVCTNTAFQDAVLTCLEANCTPADVAQAEALLTAICGCSSRLTFISVHLLIWLFSKPTPSLRLRPQPRRALFQPRACRPASLIASPKLRNAPTCMLFSFLLIFTVYVGLITPISPHSTDTTCVCTNTAFQDAVLTCLQTNCTPADVAQAEALEAALCSCSSRLAFISVHLLIWHFFQLPLSLRLRPRPRQALFQPRACRPASLAASTRLRNAPTCMLFSFLLIFTVYVGLITPISPHSTDTTCVCTNTAFQDAVATCLEANCTPADLDQAEALLTAICG
jgi:hypothetical protein